MSFFDDQIKAMLEVRNEITGDTVRIYRGDAFVDDVIATRADGQRRSDQSDVVRIVEQQDWLVMVEAWDFGDGPTKPQRGDLIVAAGVRYEALPQNGDDVFRLSGQHQYRIHTKAIA